MWWELDDETRPAPCAEFEERLLLYVADELDPSERVEIEQHMKGCGACAGALEREQRLLNSLAATGRAEPDARLLSSCRAGLADALDESGERRGFARWIESLGLTNWFTQHPALSTTVLLLIGFSLGIKAPGWLQTPATPFLNPSPASTAGMLDDELRSADVSGINWTTANDNAPPEVQVQLRAQRPLVVQGTVNNSDVKRVLVFVLQNNQRFGPDVRIDSVELLKPRCNDADVRQALCQIVRTDRNPAVRLKALEALQAAKPQDNVRDALLDALTDDANLGVRIEAINALRAMAQNSEALADPRVMGVLRERMRKDPSPYIRLQSAAVIRGLTPREKY
jgi:hypothetical protein